MDKFFHCILKYSKIRISILYWYHRIW